LSLSAIFNKEFKRLCDLGVVQ